MFDPLGWMSPVIVTAKIFMQLLWKSNLQWDEVLPETLRLRWTSYVRELQSIEPISVPRWLGTSDFAAIEVHGFSDASKDALSAVVYIRVVGEDFFGQVSLLTSKTTVTPLKPVATARLELSAAALLAKLIKQTRESMELKDAPVHLWVDSSVALAWIRSQPSRWKEFVANRVSLIQDLVPDAQWRHVAGQDNPADSASHGVSSQDLSKHRLWWSGPRWLTEPTTSWPSSIPAFPKDSNLEERAPVVHAVTKTNGVWSFIERFSSVNRLLRVTSRLSQVAERARRKEGAFWSSALTPEELNKALLFWVKKTQEEYFADEITVLSSGGELYRSSNLLRLTPFVDGEGLLRLGGRLENSRLDDGTKHPLLLPRKSHLTTLLIDQAHRRVLHGGVQSTLQMLREKIWVLGGRDPVRSFILRCVCCTRFRQERAKQLMGQLPSIQVTPSRPFAHTGVDYAGPFNVKSWRGRGAKTYKVYLIVFVCFSTSAVHLELSSDYTTEGFLAAYRRFAGRRGACSSITSDCGTNLVGADAELRRLFSAASKEFKNLREVLASDQTAWKFSPPSAPHFGGKWEAVVKSAKLHIRRVVGDALLTFEEFTTLLTQIEGILNSRPLCQLSDDPDDVSALTPGHFLIGQPLTNFPEPCLRDIAESRLSRWQRTRKMVDHFWQRWSREYLHQMAAVAKWQQATNTVKVGSIVLVIDERFPPAKWPLAKVVKLHPGKDKLVHVVTVKLASGSELQRPIVKLCVLPVA